MIKTYIGKLLNIIRKLKRLQSYSTIYMKMNYSRRNLASCLVVSLSLFIVYIQNKTYEELLETDACPLCFGKSLCNNFTQNEISIKTFVTLFKIVTYITNIFGMNNVIFASFGNTDVVVKKLAHKWEFEEVDVKFSVSNITKVSSENDIIDQIKQHFYVPLGENIIKNIRLCPTVDKFDELYKTLRISEKGWNKETLINLWFTVNVNPEPLIMKILSQENGWPVPKLLGSCGRTVISEYCGDMLTDHVQDSWNTRLSVARQLLKAALNFTFNHPSFAFYLTDVTPDNIAVSSNGKITFVDLENIIIVDKHSTAEFLPHWNTTHSSDDIECDNCFAFSSDDICSHRISDHNVYAVCREILSPRSYLIDGGLLHSPPEYFLKSNPQFWAVLLHCVQPVDNNDRFYYAKQLLHLLK